MASIPGNYIGL